MVVEDNYLIALSLVLALTEANFDVVGVVPKASAAIALAETERPNLILMDVQLAGRRSGVEAAREIYLKCGIRSLFLTSMIDSKTKNEAADVAPWGWIAKPYYPETVVQCLKKFRSSDFDVAPVSSPAAG